MRVKEKIFEKHYWNWPQIQLSELPANLLPTDVIDIERVEDFFSENESWDAHTYLRVFRERDETPEEKAARLAEIEKSAEKNRKHRYETYLRLKQEFENDPIV